MAVSSEFGGAVGRTAAASLREVTLDNLRDVLRLTVAAHQEQFVASNAVSIAQAYFYRDSAWFRAIYADDTPVGFVMLACRTRQVRVSRVAVHDRSEIPAPRVRRARHGADRRVRACIAGGDAAIGQLRSRRRKPGPVL
jgi:hypothetical protein